jgi:hypothetical protein
LALGPAVNCLDVHSAIVEYEWKRYIREGGARWAPSAFRALLQSQLADPSQIGAARGVARKFAEPQLPETWPG